MKPEKYLLINKLTDNVLKSSDKIEDLFEFAKKVCRETNQVFLIKESSTGEVVKEYTMLLD